MVHILYNNIYNNILISNYTKDWWPNCLEFYQLS